MSGDEVSVLAAKIDMVGKTLDRHEELIGNLTKLVWKIVGGVLGGSFVISTGIATVSVVWHHA